MVLIRNQLTCGKELSLIFLVQLPLLHFARFVLQEQSGNDETDMQLMKTHTETLLDTLRDIAQVNNHTMHSVWYRWDGSAICYFFFSFVRQFCQKESRHQRQTRTTLGLRCSRWSVAPPPLAGRTPPLGPPHWLFSLTRRCLLCALRSQTRRSSCRWHVNSFSTIVVIVSER